MILNKLNNKLNIFLKKNNSMILYLNKLYLNMKIKFNNHNSKLN